MAATDASRNTTRTLKVGDVAPDFTLPTHNEGRLNLHWYRGRKNVVLAFYPGDWTPVCTAQIPEFQSLLEKFNDQSTQVLGISVDSVPCHVAWAKSLGGISFPLMADYYPHGEVAQVVRRVERSRVCRARGAGDRQGRRDQIYRQCRSGEDPQHRPTAERAGQAQRLSPCGDSPLTDRLVKRTIIPYIRPELRRALRRGSVVLIRTFETGAI